MSSLNYLFKEYNIYNKYIIYTTALFLIYLIMQYHTRYATIDKALLLSTNIDKVIVIPRVVRLYVEIIHEF